MGKGEPNIGEMSKMDLTANLSSIRGIDGQVETPSLSPSTIHFPKDGLTLVAIQEFISLCGGSASLHGLTTTNVVRNFVDPMRAASKLLDCEHLRAKGSTAVGEASVFICYARKDAFLDVVAALEYHFRDEPDTIFWFDIFCGGGDWFNMALDLDVWYTLFKSAIAQFGRTVMVLSSWPDLSPLSRAWCFFEVYCTIEAGAVLEVAMTHKDHTVFVDDVTSDCQKVVDRLLATIDFSCCEAWKPLERARIFALVERGPGVSGVNSLVFECLRGWVVNEKVDQCPTNSPHPTFLSRPTRALRSLL